MKIKWVIFLFCGLFLGACKKNYSCECRNASGTYAGGDVFKTKNQAEKQCKSLSAGDTNCYVK